MEGNDRDENELRSQIIDQLDQSLAMSREMMMNQKLDPKTREKWTQLHTNTAQVLNTVLRDKQYQEWERRLKELETAGRIPRKTAGPADASHGSSGPLQRSHPERVQSCDCCSKQAAEPEDGRQDLQTLVEAGTGGARGSAEEGEARVSERVCDRGSAKQSRHHSRGDSERGRAGRVRVHRARQGIV